MEISKDEALLSKGDFCAAYLLDKVKRDGKIEIDRNHFKSKLDECRKSFQNMQLKYNNLKVENDNLRQQLQSAESIIKKIEVSTSSRVRDVITFIPRLVKGGIQCVWDYGVVYTIRRVYEKIFRNEE